MSYRTSQDILDFVEDHNVKFARFAFCDIFGVQKNIAVLTTDLATALDEGVCFDGSAVTGFMNIEESDLVLKPDLSTACILPWRPTEGRVMQVFCDVCKPDGSPFAGNCRDFLRGVAAQYKALGLTCNVGAECEFYLFEKDEQGKPTRVPIDQGGYFDVAPLDAGENVRREICLMMEQMGLAPYRSHHESGGGQNEIDFHHANPLQTADNLMLFKQIVRAVCARHGMHPSFLPKPLADQAGSGLHVNISLEQDGNNLFEGEIDPNGIAGNFMAGVLQHIQSITAFTNPLPSSYARFGSHEAPCAVSWSRQNRSQLVRIPSARGAGHRMELRSPDPACNPYLAFGLILAAGLDGIQRKLTLQPPVNENLFDPAHAVGLPLLPLTLDEALQFTVASDFVQTTLPAGLAEKFTTSQMRRCAALKSQPDPDEYERKKYFFTI